jgi:hypothetical protein
MNFCGLFLDKKIIKIGVSLDPGLRREDGPGFWPALGGLES